MRLPPIALTIFVASACGVACADADATAAGKMPATAIKSTITGVAKLWLIAPDPDPGFSQLNVDMFAADALASPATDIAPSGAASLGHMAVQSASTACSETGCQWHMPSVPLTGAALGLMAAVSDARANNPVWQTTYSLIVNPDQVQDNIVLGSAVDASAPGYVLAATSMARLAGVLHMAEGDLLARGVCLGLVWSTRGEGSGIGRGFAGATVALGGSAGPLPSIFYVNDAITALAPGGTTKADGLFVLVGPEPGAAAPASYAVPITVGQAATVGSFVGNVAIVRPGVLTVMPIIPSR